MDCSSRLFTECNFTLPLLDPDPDDDTVKVSYASFVTQIELKEEIGDIRIALFNCDGKY
jgi:hypothetical protein